MNDNACLNDQTLVLLYYGEACEDAATRHLQSCVSCRKRLATLRQDLSSLPETNYAIDDLAGTRMAARVTEQLQKPRRRLLVPAMGATAAAALVIVLTMTSTPPPESTRIVSAPAPETAIINPDLPEDMPDINFLEEMEIIRELELLAQLEGV